MALITSDECASRVRAGNVDRLYLFYGKDSGALEPFAKKLAHKLCPKDARMMNLHSFDAKAMDMEQLSDAVSVLPMFAERVVVTVSGLNMEELDKTRGDLLRRIIGDIPETTVVIISAPGEELYKNRKSLSDKNKRFADYCAKLGTVCEFSFKSVAQSGRYIVGAMNARGVKVSRSDAEYLAKLCLCDTSHINMEIEKLSAYAMDLKEVARADIDALCIKKIESDGFGLALNILNSNARFVFERIGELKAQNYEPLQILAIINMSLADIYRAKLAKSAGLPADSCAEIFAYPKNRLFAVKNAYSDCANISIGRIRRTAVLLSDTELKMKTVSMNTETAYLALEQFAATAMTER